MFPRTHRVATAALAAALVLVPVTAASAHRPDVPRYTACVEEDQTTPCVWVASRMGNGIGRSFIVTPHGFRYISDAVAIQRLGNRIR
ncbi:MAG: hypothetical protein JWO15_3917 [Sphingomonadales bacterium]|nr:hypothetical protein [Sphingomonadales bacterium]